jgi:hypothetical protein
MSGRLIAMQGWPPLACQEVVAKAATRDQQATADLILDVATKDAIAALASKAGTPSYRVARAELLLAKAGASADRILGRGPR